MTAQREPRDLVAQVLDLLARDPERAAMVAARTADDGSVEIEAPVTLTGLVAHAARLAVQMRARQLAGKRVALAVHIGEPAAALYLACQLAGIAPAMLPVPARASETAFAAVVGPLAAAFEPEVVVFDRQSFEHINAAGLIAHWRGDLPAEVWIEDELGEGVDPSRAPADLLGELRAAPHGVEPQGAPSLATPAHYLFTSGTTGHSKVVRLSRGAVVRNTLYVAERWSFGAHDRLPVLGAPYHSGGLMVGLIMPLYLGATAVVMADAPPPVHALRWLSVLAATRCTHLVGGDGLLRTLALGVPADAALRYPALRALVVGGEPLDLRTFELVERHFASRASDTLQIYTAYGMTEAAGLISTSTRARPTQLPLRRTALDRGQVEVLASADHRGRDAHVAISCGASSHGVELRIVDGDGRALPEGVLGRVEFRSDCLFDGYVTDPAQCAAVELELSAARLCAASDRTDPSGVGARFFATGDLGFRYGGELYLRGRQKEAIPVGVALLAAERVEAIARAACVAVAGHHNLTIQPVPPANGGLDGEAAPGELWVLQEVSRSEPLGATPEPGAGAAELDAVATAVADALFEALPLAACRVLLFAPGELPRLCTSAKKVRLPAAAALARGDIAPLWSRRFTTTTLGTARGDRAPDRAWSAAELARDGRWLVQVSADHADAAARATRTRRPAAEVTSSVRGVIERALRETADGTGFALLRGLPSDLPVADLEYLTAAIGAAIGQIMPQNPAGERLTHVRDRGSAPGARGYLSKQALAFHSDTSDILALFCVRPAASGGETAVVSALRVFHELAALDAGEVLATLRSGFVYAYPDGPVPPAGAEPAHDRIPVFSDCGGRISCRYLRAFVELAAQRHGRALSERERRALDLFDQIATRPDLQLRVQLQAGDLLLVNNYSVLHARTAFEDEADEARTRLLLRLWLNVPQYRPVIPRLRSLSRRFETPHEIASGR